MASKENGILYIGVTDNLIKRAYEHKHDLVEGFTKRYHVHNLVYFEIANNPISAITREKQMKKWKRNFKIEIIMATNPTWKDLYDEILY